MRRLQHAEQATVSVEATKCPILPIMRQVLHLESQCRVQKARTTLFVILDL